MEAKHFNMLAIAAVASLVTAGIVHSSYDTWTAEKLEGERLFPDFDKDAVAVGQVFLQKGKQTFTFNRGQDGNWSLAERGGYPVEGKKVRELLAKIVRAELVEAKTRDPERYDLIELGDPTKADATATLVRMSDGAGKMIGELVVGKRRASAFGAGKSGSYVRRPGNPQSWLSSTVIQIPFDVADWVETVFFRMPLAKIKSLQLTPPDGQSVDLVRETPATPAGEAAKDGKPAAKPPEPKFKFATLPQGKQLKQNVDATVIVKGLETLELTDVRKLADAKVPDDAVRIAAVVETDDAMKLEATVLRIGGDDRWVSIKVLEDGNNAEQAAKLKGAVDGWQFKIPDWRSRQVFKTAAEMFEDEPEKPKASDEGDGKAATPAQPN